MNFNLNAAKALLGAAVVAGAVTAISQPASAISFNTSAGPTSSFSGVTTVGFENVNVVVPSGSSGSSVSATGYTENGIKFTGGGIAKGSVSGQFASPPGSNNYLTLGGPTDFSPVTIALGGLKGYFGMFVGSLDTYNTIEFLKAGVSKAIFGGAALPPTNPNGNKSVGVYYNFFGDSNSDLFDTVKLSSTSPAFEVDNIATRTAIPTPALLPGLIGMGVAAWRKRRGESAEQAEA